MQHEYTDPFGEGQAAEATPGTLEPAHIPDWSNIKSLKKYFRPERLYPDGKLMSNGQVIKKNAFGVVEPTVLRPMFPKWKYHLIEQDRIVNSKKEEDELGEGWKDEPQKPLRPAVMSSPTHAVDTDRRFAELESQISVLTRLLSVRVGDAPKQETTSSALAELPAESEQKAKLIKAAEKRGIKIDKNASLDQVISDLKKATEK